MTFNSGAVTKIGELIPRESESVAEALLSNEDVLVRRGVLKERYIP